ncbi:MAG: hypothetical protein RLY20_937, partial [Verrucomicrobiota bacterium]
GSTGLFTGAVATATGPAVTDGKLQILHSNIITAVYQDASPAAQRLFTAQADLLPPVIANVAVTNRFGKAQVQWTTDEPATDRLLYGKTTALGSAVTNSVLVTNHLAVADGQVSGQTNYYRIICADEAGNLATNNTGISTPYVVPFVPPILVVDGYYADLIDPPPPIANYTDALTSLGMNHDVWSIKDFGSPTAKDLKSYRVVIWRIAEYSSAFPTGLTFPQQSATRDYLDSGGSLFMASMELVSRVGPTSAFVRDTLHVSDFTEDVSTTSVEGVPGDIIGDGINADLDYSDYAYFGFLELNYSDNITPGTGAEGFLTDFDTGEFVGLRYPALGVDSPDRVVFLSIPFDSLPTTERTTLMKRSLKFLAPGLKGQGSVAFARSAYAVPSEATVEVADSDLEGAGQISININSDSQTNNVPLALQETTRRGVFRGSFNLVTNLTGGAITELRAAPGNFVRAKYFDATNYDTSVGQQLVATVQVDNTPPGIMNIAVDRGYVDATVTWDTTELADSKVEFGESTLFGRTAFDSAQTEVHNLALTQLSPEQKYYYRIVATDRAGNVTTSTTNSFTTLTPIRPNWTDNMEHGDTNWTIYTVEESERGWELGGPGAVQPAAHSPTNCWGSNLTGDYASQIESYLISPAILLTNGNTLKLSFWHNFDFTTPSENDIYHGGELLLIPGDAVNPISLAVWSDQVSTGWEKMDVDLTAYAGRVVYLAWHYFLFSLDAAPRQGWLVDDVSVIASNTPTGTVIVSNNLWQSSFTLNGTPHSGRMFVITNAFTGTNIVTFNAVPFYNTPSAQTNILTTGATNLFLGSYTFTDANTNGISDAWELARFGVVSPTRTKTTDTDHDGMSDYAEFIAGTDPNGGALTPFTLTAQLSGTNLLLGWPTQPGWSYRVLQSMGLPALSPLSSWMVAGGMSTNLMVPLTGSARMFQIEATNSTGLTNGLSLTLTPQSATALRFGWNAWSNRAYRLWSSTNLLNWAPTTAWLPGSNNVLLAVPANSSANLYKLEVAP